MQKSYLVMLYIALGFITLLVVLTKGQPVLARKKVFLGLLILSLTTPAATLVSCGTDGKMVTEQKDVWLTEGWVDENTYRKAAMGHVNNAIADIKQRNEDARKNAILNARGEIIYSFNSVKYESCHGGPHQFEDNPRCLPLERDLRAIINNGKIILEEFDAEGNLYILYEIKSPGLKKKFGDFLNMNCDI